VLHLAEERYTMLLSRWKMMAGVLGVSLGGLVAMAGQCPKSEPTKGNPPPEMPMTSAPAAAPVMPHRPRASHRFPARNR